MLIDKSTGFGVKILDYTEKPNTQVYIGMHQCYSADSVTYTDLSEDKCGEIIVKRLLKGNRGHYSPFEHVKITFAVANINHGTLQQLLRSRIGVSPSVQSFRYSLSSLLSNEDNISTDIEKYVYLRPVGIYKDRHGRQYNYDTTTRESDLEVCRIVVRRVLRRLNEGMPDEQARSIMPFDMRQNAVVTFNARSLMGFLDRRLKADAQLEIQSLADMFMQHFEYIMPETAKWYRENRENKAILAP